MTTDSVSLPLTYAMSDGLLVNRVGYGAMRQPFQGDFLDFLDLDSLSNRAVET